MRVREVLLLAGMTASGLGCAARADGPATTAVDGAARPTVAIAATTSAPAASAAPVVATAASAPTPPPSAQALATLPPGAAVYFAARPADLSGLFALVPGSARLLRNLSPDSTEPPEHVLAGMGVDVRRPVLGAVVPASEKSARAVIDGVAAGASDQAQAKITLAHAADATRFRVLVPLVPGADARRAAAAIAEPLTFGAELDVCPGAASCAGFGAGAPLFVARGGPVAIGAYADGGDLRLDIAMPLFVTGTDPGALAALVAFRSVVGGFAGKCSQLDGTAAASLCVDAGPAGELGATIGYSKTTQALVGGGIEPKMRAKIAAQGRSESQQNLALAAPARRLATDGTVTITLQDGRVRSRASWALTDASRSAIEKAFGVERCAAGRAVGEELLPALTAAFGDPGPGFTDPRATTDAIKEAGWAAYAVALAGTWPNVLGSPMIRRAVEVPPGMQACARAEAGRLVLVVSQTP